MERKNKYSFIWVMTMILFIVNIAQSQPDIEVEPDRIDFGVVSIDDHEHRNLTITNSEDEILVIDSILIDNDAFSFHSNELELEHFFPVELTPYTHSIMVEEVYWDEEALAEGDEVGVFTPDYLCVGASEFNGADERLSIVAFADDDEFDDEITGFLEGQEIEFRIYDPVSDCEVIANANFTYGDELFHLSGFSIIILTVEGGSHRFGESGAIIRQDFPFIQQIYFQPEEIQDYEATLTIYSNDPDEEIIEIPISGTTLEVTGNEASIPSKLDIIDIYPNPFNSTTIITYGLGKPAPTRLALYDLSGREVMTLFEGYRQAGFHSVNLHAGDLQSGIYFVRFEGLGEVATRKVMLIR